MPYAIGRRSTGVYEVLAFQRKDELIATRDVVQRNGKALIFDHVDEARLACRLLNRDRLRRFRAKKASQMKLFEEGV